MLLVEKVRSRGWSFEKDPEVVLHRTSMFLEALSKGPSALTIDMAALTGLRNNIRSYKASSVDDIAWDVLRFDSRHIAFDEKWDEKWDGDGSDDGVWEGLRI